MAITKLQSEIDTLINFFAMTGRGDLISMITESGSGDLSDILAAAGVASGDIATLSTEAREQIAIVQALICDKSEGAYTTQEIVNGIGKEHLAAFGPDIINFINVYYEPTLPNYFDTDMMPFQDGIRSMCRSLKIDEESGQRANDGALTDPDVNDDDALKSPSRYNSPSLSAIVLPNLSLGPPTRNTDAVSLFVNGIPTLELSRCVPLINLRFVAMTTEGLSETTKQLSLLRFLGVSATGDTSDKIGLSHALPNLKSTGITSEFSLETGASSAGMELFTSPQTLINADINSSEGNTSGRTTKVLDPFKPLMTLNSVSVSIQGLGQELLSSKTATVQITLHDRSRLADIAPIVAIDLFGMTSVSLEYGWSHPDGEETSDNAIGRFLNSLRSKELFNIVSSNYTMGNDGQVKITLRLAARGTTASMMVPAAAGEVIPTAIFKPILVSELSKKLQSIDEADENVLKEIRSDIRVNLNNAGSPSSVVPRELFKALLSVMGKSTDDSTVTETTDTLAEIIETMIGTDGTGGEFMNINSSLTSAFDDKSWAILHDEATDDFKPDDTVIAEMFPAQASNLNSKQYVSLGKLIMLYIGYPLASCGRFDEVQIIFYRFNMQAGFARRLDISEFVVDAVDLQGKLDKLKDQAPGVSISRFMSFLNSKYVANPANANYGLTDLYAEKSELLDQQKAAEAENGSMSEDEKENYQIQLRAIDDKLDARLVSLYQNDDLGIATPDFTLPNLKFYIESMPMISGDPPIVDDSKTILRVHIFDRAASPHATEMFMISALTDSEIAAVVRDSGGVPSEMTPEVGAQMGGPGFGGGTIMVTEENIEEIAQKLNDTHYKTVASKVSANSMKKTIKATIPSFNFGSQFSAIKSISLSATTQAPWQIHY